MKRVGRKFRTAIFFFALLSAVTDTAAAVEAPSSPPTPAKGRAAEFFHDLLPTAWQRRPTVRFNVYTEMMPEGRKWRVPTSAHPIRYFSSPARFAQTGWSVAAGEKPPPREQLELAMREALAANGYVPIENELTRPDILIVFSFGSSGTDPVTIMTDAELNPNDPPPTSADVLVNALIHDPALYRDVLERARFVAGDKFAIEMRTAVNGEFSNRRFNQTLDRLPQPPEPAYLPVSPDFGSPFQVFMESGNGQARHLAELAFHTLYFVTATAFDFKGVEKKQNIPLWQTRMTVEAQGVDLREVLKPLIVNTGSYLGRDTPETAIVSKRIDRQGRVDIGTPTVVEPVKPTAAPANSGAP